MSLYLVLMRWICSDGGVVRSGVGGLRWTGSLPDIRCDARLQHGDERGSPLSSERVSPHLQPTFPFSTDTPKVLNNRPPHRRRHRRQLRPHQHANRAHRARRPRHLRHLASLREYAPRTVPVQLYIRSGVGLLLESSAGLYRADLEGE